MDKTGIPSQPDEKARWRSMLLGCVAVMTVILLGWMLRAAAIFFVPVVFSIFLALLVAPVDRWGTKRAPDRFPWLGHVAAMGTILLALLVFLGSVWFASQQVVERFPLGSGETTELLPSLGEEDDDAELAPAAGAPQPETGSSPQDDTAADAPADDTTGTGSDEILSRFGELFGVAGGSLSTRLAEWASSYATTVLSAAGTTLGAAVLVFFLTLMMLIEGPRWPKKFAYESHGSSKQGVVETARTIAQRLRGFLWARTIMGVMTAFLYVVWLWIFGIDLLIVWALLTFFLSFIPTLGSLIAGILPVLYALAQKDLGTAVFVGIGLLVIEQIMGNYVDPRVQGRKVSLSPLVVLIALLLWGWMWGIAGAVLAVPMTIAIAIISAHFEPLRPLALILSNKTEPEGIDRVATPDSQ
ncbi:AI-2E family transporter [Citreimonas salinaria]|uniref:AI-2 transport protein TqsA n=1 Tax=Citreimonas salinaria TaxID=321339 RepID=A0A1H3KN05_9RHOB|nr:AI-2E family transporter [Citreimonas salinaria]SDY53531.1 AI-2 transport protein TqsA [Citreimonas salinaria]